MLELTICLVPLARAARIVSSQGAVGDVVYLFLGLPRKEEGKLSRILKNRNSGRNLIC